MEIITIKHKEFIIEKSLGKNSSLVSRKGKPYFLKHFEDVESYESFILAIRRISNAGIPCPQVEREDAKSHNVLLTYIKGESVADLLAKDPLNESIIEMLYKVNFLAKSNKMLLNFYPEYFIYTGDCLYYIGYAYYPYSEKEDLLKFGIRYWYYTNELKEYLSKRGIEIDRKKMKQEYEVNREIMLTAVKFYK